MPDLATLPNPRTGTKSPAKRVLKKLAPRCLDNTFHSCWSSPSVGNPKIRSESDREFAKDIEVGDFYFKEKNYAGAESRFLEALELKPNDPETTLKLARSLDRLRKGGQAQAAYQAYLELQPNGPFANEARVALKRLESTATR